LARRRGAGAIRRGAGEDECAWSGGEGVDRLGEFVRGDNRCEDREGDATVDKSIEAFADVGRAAKEEGVLDQLPGSGGRGSLTVAGLPCAEHVLDLLAVAEPAIEGGVDGDGDVGGEHEAGEGLDGLALPREAEKSTEELEVLRRGSQLIGDLAEGGEWEEVGERSVGPVDRELEHLAAKCGDDDRNPVCWWRLQLEAGRCAFAGQGRAEEVKGVAHAGEGGLEWHPVPAFDDSVRGGADSEDEAAVGGVGQGGSLLGKECGTALEDADDSSAEARLVGPCGGESERREAVGTVRLTGPEVRVTGGVCPEDKVSVVSEWKPREREGESPSASHCGASLDDPVL